MDKMNFFFDPKTKVRFVFSFFLLQVFLKTSSTSFCLNLLVLGEWQALGQGTNQLFQATVC